MNSLELDLFSDDAEFSILNPTGYYAGLKERQPLAVYELVDGNSLFLGQYYLEAWENTSDTEITFRCLDLLGVLDSVPYRGGIWTGTGVALETLIQEMMEAVSAPYELDASLNGTAVVGWIPACSYREALQQIAFAVGATVDCSRSWAVRIYATKIAAADAASATITKAQKGAEQSLALKPLVTAVEVTAHDYVESTNSKELYNGSLVIGTYEITFSEPMHDLSATGATISDSGANYAILSVSTPSPVVLNGQTYTDTQRVLKIAATGLSSSVKPNVLKITNATLIGSNNLSEATQRIYDYNQQRYLQKLKLYVPAVEVGQVVEVETLYGEKIRGVVEKLELDLAFGFTAKAEITGVKAS